MEQSVLLERLEELPIPLQPNPLELTKGIHAQALRQAAGS
jgi:hypothetical protein